MSVEISDSVRLMGMIVKTKPFLYQNNIVTCSYESHVDINDLKNIKKDLEIAQRNMEAEHYTDEQRTKVTDDLYFIDTVIQTLEGN